jgi:PAS domain S-box-containing protein
MNPSIEASAEYYARLQKKLAIAAIVSAIVVIFFASTVLTGYITNSVSLIRFPFSASGMNPMAAVSFLIAGSALLISGVRRRTEVANIAMLVAGVFLLVLGISRLCELAGLFDLRLDMLVFRNRLGRAGVDSISGRMSYTTALAFILTGTAFLTNRKKGKGNAISQYILFIVIIISFFTLTSILYGVSDNYFGPPNTLKMALGSSICFLLTAHALLMANYHTGVVAVITSNSAGGRMARIVLPFAILFPLLAGIVDRFAESSGVEDAWALALFSILTMILLFIFIVRTARSNNLLYRQLENEIDERKKAVGEAYSADLFAKSIYDNIPNMVFVKDAEMLRFRIMNKAGERMIGIKQEDLMGKSDLDFFPEEQAEFFKVRDQEVFTTNEPVITEERITTKERGLRWLRTTKIGVRDESGKPLYMIGISEDITELKEKQEQLNRYYAELEEKVKERTKELHKSEKRFHAIIQSAPDAMIIADEKESIQMVNTQTERLFGYTKSELIGRPIDFLIPQNTVKATSGQDHAGYELFGKTKNGAEIPVEISFSPIETSEGTLISVSIRDITERKRAEKILIENELKFRDLTQNMPGVIYQWIERFDGTEGPVYASPKLKQYFRLDPKDIDKLPDLVHPEDKQKWRNSLNESKSAGSSWFFEGRLLYPDGEIKWLRATSVKSLANEKGRLSNGILMDITEQKLIEDKILQNQKRYEAIFNSQYQFMGMLMPDGTLVEVNETALTFAGLKQSEVIGKPFWECYWWTTSERVQNELRRSIEQAAKGEFIRYETEIAGKDGVIACIDFSIKPVVDDSGQVIMLIPEGRDITERKALEQKSREQEEQIRLFVKHTPAAVAMFDHQMKYMIASDRWYSDYGLEGQQIIGKSHYEVFPEINDMPEWKADHQYCLKGGVVKKEDDPFPRPDGTIEWLRYEIYPWRRSNDVIGGIIMFTEVISEKIEAQKNLKKLNEQLIESNRELEQFAYVASHDLQEPLRMVSSFLQLLEKKYKAQLDDPAKQYIHFAVDGSERMKVLINDLLKFSRVGTGTDERASINCAEIAEGLLQVYEQKIGETGATINVGKLPVILGNRTQIEQLFQNLIGNAIKYRGKEPPVISIGAEPTEDGKWKFHVKDNGIGIESKFFEKVFVIFQRLHGKNEYSGTGIGLAICKKIVERHGGKIWIESVPGKGSTFYFTLAKG